MSTIIICDLCKRQIEKQSDKIHVRIWRTIENHKQKQLKNLDICTSCFEIKFNNK